MATQMGTVTVRGKALGCVVCESSYFYSREIKMQTTGMTFFDLDWANKSAEGAICASCGFVHMFADGGLEWTPADLTGGTSGIGLAIAQRYAAEGARVFVTGRRQDALDQAVATIGADATGLVADASKADDVARLFDVVREQAGRIDVLVANAGGGSFAPLGAITEEQYHDTFDSNVLGTLLTVQGSLPLLVDGASVVLMSSTAATLGDPAFSIYGASKAAVRSFARGWAVDLKERGIRVNALAPGPTETPGLVGLVPDDQRQGLLDSLAGEVPLGRVADPSEIAGAALFLASPDASFVNGVVLFADGGMAQV